jgi:heat induced stress protein YflT
MMQHQPVPIAADRPTVGSYDTYPRAQRAVDFLSDNKFPVERTAIIGSDLRMVETVLAGSPDPGSRWPGPAQIPGSGCS